jgi:hypothetical protein
MPVVVVAEMVTTPIPAIEAMRLFVALQGMTVVVPTTATDKVVAAVAVAVRTGLRLQPRPGLMAVPVWIFPCGWDKQAAQR